MSDLHPPLYHRDTKGRLREWRVERELERYRTIAGLVDGEKVTSEWTTCEAKNVGKVNHINPVEQCLREVEALYTKKLDRKYHPTPDLEGDKPIFPMLAQTYKDWDSLLPKGNHPANAIHVCCQPKLDGVRCIAKKDGLFSREGKPHRGLEHISEALEDLFADFPDAILDGELYNHELRDDFNTIVSAVKRGDPELAKCIQYHVYDMVSPEPFSRRTDWLRILDRYVPLPVVRVQTHLVPTKLALDSLYELYLKQGYEGQMVRSLYGGYEVGKRSKLLLKRKEFQDAEFPVVAIEEGKGNWAGVAKRAILRLPDGRTFGAGIKGKKEFLKGLLEAWTECGHEAVGQTATVKFFSLTPDGVPRFPVVTAFYAGKRDV